MNAIIRKLAVGDRRQKGASEAVVAQVLREPRQFRRLLAGLRETEPAVRMRVADAVEKISRARPELLWPFKREFIGSFAKIEQKEVRWHLAQIFPRLPLTPRERARVFEILVGWLADDSRIVKTFAMQGLADIAESDGRYRVRASRIVQRLAAGGIPAVCSRAKKLLPRLRRPPVR